MNICGENRQLLVAANRYVPYYQNTTEMKLDYNLDINDFKKAMLEQFKKRYFFAIFIYIPFSLLISFLFVQKEFIWNRFLISFVVFFIFFMATMIIPDFLKHTKIVKSLNSNPKVFGKKTLEINDSGIRQFSENILEIGFYKWQEVKKISKTENYTFITLKNSISIILPKTEIEYINVLKQYLKKYGT